MVLAGCSDSGREERRRAAGPGASFAALMRVADAEAGAAAFGQCGACHTVRRGGGDRNGPNLFGVVGSPIAGNSPRFGYTAALQDVGGDWTRERMDAWLTNPQRFAPGTSMRFPGVADPLVRADIIAYLATQK
ncbi:c-type cytochrome [Sphingomonas jeddahensis]|uniref:Cytochrome c-552 n=1 Tax=Sphingomonas jeddahensis TaxID=1915074 RepID=A0A1V2ERB2_9SPHN|nr:c-type cytochrome [Sphingomonas jeddahensis]ONF95202.1 Cytochrome c-552 [Sphingomonas jeddahensis]